MIKLFGMKGCNMLLNYFLILVLVVNGFLFTIWNRNSWINVLIKLTLLSIVILDVILLYKSYGGV